MTRVHHTCTGVSLLLAKLNFEHLRRHLAVSITTVNRSNENEPTSKPPIVAINMTMLGFLHGLGAIPLLATGNKQFTTASTNQCSRRRRELLDRTARRERCTKMINGDEEANTNNEEGGVTQTTALVVVDHGSKRQAANNMLFDIADNIRSRTNVPVFAAHMELAKPTITDAVDQCSLAEISHIIVVPFFLSPGRHATTDIPQLTAEAVARHAGMSYEVRPPIGTHPAIIDVVLDRAGFL